jgi:hypothetical protein
VRGRERELILLIEKGCLLAAVLENFSHLLNPPNDSHVFAWHHFKTLFAVRHLRFLQLGKSISMSFHFNFPILFSREHASSSEWNGCNGVPEWKEFFTLSGNLSELKIQF